MLNAFVYDEFEENDTIADYLIENGVVLLPCKVGDVVYVIKYCRCGNTEPYKAGHCLRKTTKTTPKVLAQKMELQKGKKLKWSWNGEIYHTYEDIGTICHRVYEKPFDLNMLTSFGKTVFLSREEAEAKLKEGAG